MACLITCLLFSQVSHSETIRVVTEYLEPYQIKQPDGQLGGYMTEVVRALFHVTGDTADIEVMPWARAFQTAKTQKNVLIYSIVETEERREHFHWIGKIATAPIYFWGLKKHFPQTNQSVLSLRDYRVSVLRGSNITHYLEKKSFRNLVPMTEEQQLLKMLMHERVDLIVGSEKTMSMRLKNNKTSGELLTRVTEISELNTYLSMAFHITSDPALVARYKDAFATLSHSGELAKIRNKWAGELYAKKTAH